MDDLHKLKPVKLELTEEGARVIRDTLESPPPITDRLREAAESYNNGGIDKILAKIEGEI